MDKGMKSRCLSTEDVIALEKERDVLRNQLDSLKSDVLSVLEHLPQTDEDGFCSVCVEYDGHHTEDCELKALIERCKR